MPSGEMEESVDYQRDTSISKNHFRWNWAADLPFGKGKPLLGNAGKALDKLVGGWQVAGIGSANSTYYLLNPNSSNYFPTLCASLRQALELVVLIMGRPTGVLNDCVGRHGRDSHGPLRQVEKWLTPTLGFLPVESEGELIKVVAEMLMTHRALVGSHQP
jgi:hypothetical protein